MWKFGKFWVILNRFFVIFGEVVCFFGEFLRIGDVKLMCGFIMLIMFLVVGVLGVFILIGLLNWILEIFLLLLFNFCECFCLGVFVFILLVVILLYVIIFIIGILIVFLLFDFIGIFFLDKLLGVLFLLSILFLLKKLNIDWVDWSELMELFWFLFGCCCVLFGFLYFDRLLVFFCF